MVLNVHHGTGEHSCHSDEENHSGDIEQPHHLGCRKQRLHLGCCDEHSTSGDEEQRANRPDTSRAMVVQEMRNAESEDHRDQGPESHDVANRALGSAQIMHEFRKSKRERVRTDKSGIGQIGKPECPAVNAGHLRVVIFIGGGNCTHSFDVFDEAVLRYPVPRPLSIS